MKMSSKKISFSTISYIYDMTDEKFPVPTKTFDGSSTDKNYPSLNIKQKCKYKKESIFVASVIGITTGIFYIVKNLS